MSTPTKDEIMMAILPGLLARKGDDYQPNRTNANKVIVEADQWAEELSVVWSTLRDTQK